MKFSLKIGFVMLGLFGSNGLYAGSASKKTSPKRATETKKATTDSNAKTNGGVSASDNELKRLEGLYRMGALNLGSFWNSLDELSRAPDLSLPKRIVLKQLQANLLLKSGYPLAAATYAYDAIKESKNPISDQVNSAWKVLHTVSTNRPIQYLLEDIALNLNLKENIPPYFGNDWNYIVANGLSEKGDSRSAEEYYERLKMGDRYFMPARYQIAMIALAQTDTKKAEASLNAILNKTALTSTALKDSDKMEMWNYANMALGRIKYQERSFFEAVQHYRKVKRDSPLFYDALFEQSWALFMGGNPKHALGTLYGVHSPYFKDLYNPESDLLDAMVYYWMCRYDHSRNALANFAENYAQSVEGLRTFLDRKRISSDSAYQLFEDVISGVSSEALGIPRNVLTTAAEKDTMLLVRDQYATVVDEKGRMESRGIFGTRQGTEAILGKLGRIEGVLRRHVGEQFLVELKGLKEQFDELYSQSQFLYLELLMSEKEQLMGSELHAATKVTSVSKVDNIRGWTPKTQSWKFGKEEYWWDEVGYHIIAVEPKCNVQ